MNAGNSRSDAERIAARLKTEFESETDGSSRESVCSDIDRTMLQYAAKLTWAPQSLKADDVDRMREVGFGDRAIHDICVVTAYFAFVNRIADGLGVELEG